MPILETIANILLAIAIFGLQKNFKKQTMNFKFNLFPILFLLLLAACNQSHDKDQTKLETAQIDTVQVKINELNEKIKQDPNDAKLYRERADLYQLQGNYNGGFNDAQRAVSIDSTDALNWLSLGKAAFAVENYLRVEEAYIRCMRVAPKNTEAYIKLAEFYLLRRKYTDALTVVNAVLKIDQNLARPYFIKGWVYMEQGDTLNAKTSYQTAIELDPNFYDGFIMLGSLYTTKGKDEALDYFNSALAIRPNSKEALYFIGMHYQNTNRTEQAVVVYDTIISLDSSYAKAYYNKGYIALQKEDYKSAFNLFDQAVRFAPEYYQAYYNRGLCRELLGEKTLAQSDYKMSLGINGDYTLAQEALNRVQR